MLQAVSHFIEFGQKETRNIKLHSDTDNCAIELVNEGGNKRVVTARLHFGGRLKQIIAEEWAEEGRRTSG